MFPSIVEILRVGKDTCRPTRDQSARGGDALRASTFHWRGILRLSGEYSPGSMIEQRRMQRRWLKDSSTS
jgi:hypothetical protein